MSMLDTFRSLPSELIYRLLYIVAESFHHIAYDKIARSIEPVMAVDTDVMVLVPSIYNSTRILLFSKSIDEYYECCYFFRYATCKYGVLHNLRRWLTCGRNFRHGWEFVIADAPFFEASWIIDWAFM